MTALQDSGWMQPSLSVSLRLRHGEMYHPPPGGRVAEQNIQPQNNLTHAS